MSPFASDSTPQQPKLSEFETKRLEDSAANVLREHRESQLLTQLGPSPPIVTTAVGALSAKRCGPLCSLNTCNGYFLIPQGRTRSDDMFICLKSQEHYELSNPT